MSGIYEEPVLDNTYEVPSDDLPPGLYSVIFKEYLTSPVRSY